MKKPLHTSIYFRSLNATSSGTVSPDGGYALSRLQSTPPHRPGVATKRHRAQWLLAGHHQLTQGGKICRYDESSGRSARSASAWCAKRFSREWTPRFSFKLRRCAVPEKQSFIPPWFNVARPIRYRRMSVSGDKQSSLSAAHVCCARSVVIHRRMPAQLSQTPDFHGRNSLHARPVIRLADIHRISDRGRLHSFLAPTFPVLQETRHRIVNAGGGDKAFHPGRPNDFASKSLPSPKLPLGTEITSWLRAPRQLRRQYGFKVVANLRQQAADINRIVRPAPAPFSVLRHQMPVSPAPGQASKSPSIATVSNVAAQRTEQFFLQRTDLPRG